ncbi:class I SAM-dependent methyltransferase [Bradyrhizobium betae]|uniref:class I SAM-dependent methyltransferase n=1 Tax=Bradyrhizobium betae TaxID=244734 RepID=UPI003D667F9D
MTALANHSPDSSRQKQHYTAIHDAYEAHYYDVSSMKYRARFMYNWLFDGLDLNNKSIADLACGSGHNSLAIIERYHSVKTVGFDISTPACESYTRTTQNTAHVIDLTKPAHISEQFDGAIIIGGLHHCVADLRQTLRNVANLVKPGGDLLMMEPSADFALNVVRNKWYASDRYFDAPTEEALSHDAILKQASPYFEGEAVRYFGGLAYFLILNSLIMRVPLGIKPILWPLVKPFEVAFSNIPLPSMYPCFLAKWKRTAVPVS